MIVTVLSILGFLAYTNNLNTTYQNRINQTTKQLEQEKAEQRLELDRKLQEQQQEIEKLKQENARLTAIRASRNAVVARVGLSTNCNDYRSLVAQYDWNVSIAMAVMQAESGCNPSAHSPTADRGLMQINQVHAAKVGGNLNALFDPATNVRVAYQVYQGAGWSAWSVYKNGAYLRYM